MGKAMRKAWMALLSREQWKVGELAERLDVLPQQVKRQLRFLVRHGLAQKLGDGIWKGVRLSVTGFESLAQQLGVDGAGVRQRKVHKEERGGLCAETSKRKRIPSGISLNIRK